MIFSASTTHALRAVAWLASHGGEKAVMGRELARTLKVPPEYLSKVLGTLARNGVLNASRGVKGGYRLARPAERIRLAEVIEPFEGKRTHPACVLRPERPCRDSGACSAHAAWGELKRTYVQFLDKTTVADIRGER
jgi:Rrf2 family protein